MIKQCIAPYQIQEGDLVAFIEGAASPGVVRHINSCPACASEVAALRRVDSLLSMSLRAVTAPAARLTPIAADRGHRRAALTNVKRPYPRAGSFWPGLRLPETVWRTVSLLAALLVVLAATTVLYYRFSPTWPGRLQVTPGYYDFGTAPDNVEPIINSPAEPANSSEQVLERTGVSAAVGGIVEHNAAIAPPRDLLRALSHQWSGVIEDTPAIAPPRHLLLMLQREMRPEN